MMRSWMRFVAYLVVIIGVSSSFAGSYEDFFTAIRRDDTGTLRQLLQRGFDSNTPSPEGQHGLYLALRDEAPRVAELLAGWPQTRVEHRNLADESPLMMAALKGRLAIARKLIERDADVNKPGWAPLHYAATGGHLDMIRLLLEHHAYIDAESPNGSTPLMMAAMYGSSDAVRLLLDEGADASLKNQLGLDARAFALRVGRQDVADLIAARLRQKAPAGAW